MKANLCNNGNKFIQLIKICFTNCYMTELNNGYNYIPNFHLNDNTK